MEEGGTQARFAIGEVVRHVMFGYRGVVYDVDPWFSLSEQWYEEVARSRPPKDRPWYRVLVHGAGHATYVAERNLARDPNPEPVVHPALDRVFDRFENGAYIPLRRIQ